MGFFFRNSISVMFKERIQRIKDKKIGVFAPSSAVHKERFEKGLSLLHKHGFETIVHPQCYLQQGQSAGSVTDKINALNDLLDDQSIGLIIAAAGGNRAIHLLDKLPYQKIRDANKLFCGFSDFTALNAGLYSQSAQSSIFGPVVQSLDKLSDVSKNMFFNFISGELSEYSWSPEKLIQSGDAEGIVYGGTLSVLCSLAGTPYFPNIEGGILYIEDCNEELSRIDRYLAQLRLAIPFNKLRGLVIGDFSNSLDSGTPFGFSLEDIIRENCANIKGPVVLGSPHGHGQNFYPAPYGHHAKLIVYSDDIRLAF